VTLALSRFIETVQVMAPAGQARDVEWMPDGRTTIVFRQLVGRASDLTLMGPRTRAHFKHACGVERAVMVRFKPGWSAALFRVAASTLTDRLVSLEDMWGRAASELRDELVASSTAQIALRISRELEQRALSTVEPASARLARRAVRLLEAGEVRVDNVAAQLGVTARHLRRAFIESIGIGPKDFARTVRLQRALRMTATSRDWGRIATAAGYYDQAHLIGDFKELVGLTPGAFVKRASRPAAQVNAGVTSVSSSSASLPARP